jgi:putative SOS response-associated peptidase YedK
MCGRYTLTTKPERIASLFDLPEPPPIAPRYNIAPTQDVLIVRACDAGRRGAMVRWGLIPHWAKDADIGSRLINARAETAASKPAFRAAWKRRRCLVPADGFYEWKKTPSGKQPCLIGLPDGEPFALAGLWERWEGPPDGGEPQGPVESCTILTTEPNELVAEVHNRMPVILPAGDWPTWLGEADADGRDPTDLTRPYPGELTLRPVSRRVNSPARDDPSCIEPA